MKKRLSLGLDRPIAATNFNVTDISSIDGGDARNFSSSSSSDGAQPPLSPNRPTPEDPWFYEYDYGTGSMGTEAMRYREPWSHYSEVQTFWRRVMVLVAEEVSMLFFYFSTFTVLSARPVANSFLFKIKPYGEIDQSLAFSLSLFATPTTPPPPPLSES